MSNLTTKKFDMVDIIKKIKKFGGWIVGAVAFVSACLGILNYYQSCNQNPKIVINVMSEETILNPKPLKDFTFNKQSLYITKLDSLLLTKGEMSSNIKVVTLRVENEGKSAISENLYDTKRPIAIGFGKGGIISFPNFITTNEELKKVLEENCEVTYPSKITLPNLILNGLENFDIAILVSFYTDDISIYSYGKIACQDSIPIKIGNKVYHITAGTSKERDYKYIFEK